MSQTEATTCTSEATIPVPTHVSPPLQQTYWVSAPEMILASAALIRAIADLIRALRERRK